VPVRASEGSEGLEGKAGPHGTTGSEMLSGFLRGRVTDMRMKPISEATILITEGPEHKDIASMTDRNGRYSFYDLTPGQYKLMANAEGYEQSIQKARVTQGETATLNFQLIQQAVE
jgi:protocatechuate 3,4-dioxygenase beta subunit